MEQLNKNIEIYNTIASMNSILMEHKSLQHRAVASKDLENWLNSIENYIEENKK